jgi:flagellar FliJ protein
MSPFDFSLGRILDLRRQVEKEKALSLAEARRRSEEARKAWEDLEEIRRAGRESLARAHESGGSIGQIRNMEFVLEQMAGKVDSAQERRREADENLVESVKRYTDAFRERRTLDRLRSRRLEQWKTEEKRREQKDMDEVAITRYGRPAPGSAGD